MHKVVWNPNRGFAGLIASGGWNGVVRIDDCFKL